MYKSQFNFPFKHFLFRILKLFEYWQDKIMGSIIFSWYSTWYFTICYTKELPRQLLHSYVWKKALSFGFYGIS